MKINIHHCIDGAKQARGITVIIDVFRAFSVECYLMKNHVEKILPVASKELAYKLKKEHPDYILIGERDGIMLPGFDFGNSPAQIEQVDFTGRTVVHTTSAGTQGLENATGASEILTGSLVNARAVANYILRKINCLVQADFPLGTPSNQSDLTFPSDAEVSLVCMGLNGVAPTQEDDLCATYIKSLLEGNEIDISKEINDLKYTSGKKFFDPLQKEVFPERDFELCTDLNRFEYVLRYERDKTGFGYIRSKQ